MSSKDGKREGIGGASHNSVSLGTGIWTRTGQALPTHLRITSDSWRVDEAYVKVKGKWKYLYRAVDSAGNTLDFLLTAKRDALFRQAIFSESAQSGQAGWLRRVMSSRFHEANRMRLVLIVFTLKSLLSKNLQTITRF